MKSGTIDIMKKLLKTYIVPHAPVLIPEVGRTENSFCRETVIAMQKIAQQIAELKPKRIVVVSPHGLVFSDAFSVYYRKKLKTNFDVFTLKNIDVEYKTDMPFIDKATVLSAKKDITLAKIDESLAEHFNASLELDRGVSVPLYFINQVYSDFELVPITYGLLPVSELYEFGMILRQCIETSDKSTVFLASGDLSHCLSTMGPYNYSPNGKKFDDMLMDTLSKNKVFQYLTYSSKEKDLAQTCAYQSLCVMYGLFEKSIYKSNILSYEAPFGVGYLVAALQELAGISPSIISSLRDFEEAKIVNVRKSEDDYIKLARDTIEYYVRNKRMPFLDRTKYDIKVQKAGCFVTIKAESGLRGCIGTVEAKKQDVFQEIISNAILSCSEDDRFEQVEDYELEDLYISVDILSELEPVTGISDLSPDKYGIVVSSGDKKGVLLPALEGINSAQQQIAIAIDKAGIKPGESYSVSRFTVERHETYY